MNTDIVITVSIIVILVLIVYILASLHRIEDYLKISPAVRDKINDYPFKDPYQEAFEGDPINPDKRTSTIRS